MIEQSGSVVGSGARTVIVQTTPLAHCEACAAGRGCGAGLFARLLSRGVTRLEVAAEPGIRPGDRVTIGVDERLLLRASVRLYGTFLLALVAGAAAGHAVAVQAGWPADAAAAAGGILAMFIGMLWLRRRPARIQARIVAPAGDSVPTAT